MAPTRRKSSGSSDADKLSKALKPETLRSLWSGVSKTEWFEFLQATRPELQWTMSNDGIQGSCPFPGHDDSTPSFRINLDRGYAKCFGCNKYVWNPVELYRMIYVPAKTYGDALREILDRYKPKGISKNFVKQLTAIDQHRQMKYVFHQVTNMALVQAAPHAHLNTPDSEHGYAYAAVRYLLNRRNLPLQFHLQPIGVMPPQVKLRSMAAAFCTANGYDLELVEALMAYVEPYKNDTNWLGSLLFFYGSAPDAPSRVKMLQIPPEATKPQAVDPYVQALDKPQKITSFIPDEQELEIGFFGLYGVRPYDKAFSQQAALRVCVVEGEFDALSIIGQQCDAGGRVNFMAMAASGNGHNGVDILRNYSVREVHLVGDDDAGGDTFIKGILDKTKSMPLQIFKWPPHLKANLGVDHPTDPDQAIEEHTFDVVESALAHDSYYMQPHTWVAGCALREMSDTSTDNVRQLTAVAARWGMVLSSAAERQSFLKEVTEKYPTLDITTISQEILDSADNEEEFLNRMEQVLRDRFGVLSKYSERRGWYLQCFHKESRQIMTFLLSDARQNTNALTAMERTDIVSFVRNVVGEPGHLGPTDEEESGNPSHSPYLTRSTLYSNYLEKVVARLGSSVPLEGKNRQLGAGTHWVEAETKAGTKYHLYVVQGNKLTRGTYANATSAPVWEDCPSLTDPGINVFTNEQNEPIDAFPHIDISYLRAKPKYNIREMFHMVRDAIDMGWRFKNHDVTSTFLAAAVVLMPILDCVLYPPLVMFNGAASSGKSSFIGGVLGGSEVPGLKMVAAHFMSAYTHASVRQAMNNCTLPLCLDEFEDKGRNDKHTHVTQNILQMLRGLVNGAVHGYIGSVSGRAIPYTLRCAVWIAAIRMMTDLADLSRYIVVETDQVSSMASPEARIIQRFGDNFVPNIKQHIESTMFHGAMAFREAQEGVRQQFRTPEVRQRFASFQDVDRERLRQQFYGPMAIMEMAGVNHLSFLRDYLRDNRIRLAGLARNANDVIFDKLYNTPAIRIPNNDSFSGAEDMCVRLILQNGMEDIMHMKNCGVYYHPEYRWLIVHWATAAPVFFRNDHTIDVSSYPQLRARAQHAGGKNVVTDAHMARCGVLDEPAVKLSLGPVSVNECTAYKISGVLAETERSNAMTASIAMPGRERPEELLGDDYNARLAATRFPTPPPRLHVVGSDTTAESTTPENRTTTNTNNDDGEFDY